VKYEILSTGLGAFKGSSETSVAWRDVTRFARIDVGGWSTGAWTLDGENGQVVVSKWAKGYASILQAVLQNVSSQTIEAPTAREYSKPLRGARLEMHVINLSSVLMASLAWLLFAGLSIGFAYEAITDSATAGRVLPSLLFGLMALGSIVPVGRVWHIHLTHRIQLDDCGAHFAKGRQVTTIPWSELLMYESLWLLSGRAGPTYRATFVGQREAWSLDHFGAEITKIEQFVAGRAPDGAFVLLKDAPGSLTQY
jgi:hypothetical protein